MALDKFQAMELFVRVVETGGVTRAADSLGLPKATATTLIQKLEASLGVKLLNRTTRRVSVTPDGAAYYERCVTILAQLRETEESLTRQHATPRGRLRVNVPTLMARSVFVPALPLFFARYPDIELALACSERHVDLIEEGIDCAIWRAVKSRIPVSSHAASDFFTLPPARLLPTSPNTANPPIQATWRGTGVSITSRRARAVYPSGFSPRTRPRVQTSLQGHIALEDENSYVAAAEAGLGIAQVPAFILKEAMERGSLELVLGDWFPEPAPLYVVYPQNRHLSSKVRVFVDWIAELLSDHDGIQLRSTLHEH